jgi:predicted RNase H-like HicB family nuclease
MRNYIALIHKDQGSDYGVSFPDLPGLISAGDTLDEALEMSAEALAFHLEGMAADGDVVPEPSSLEAIMSDPANRDAVAVLVAAAEGEPRVVRVNITLTEDVLREIDIAAERQGFTRSGFLAAAARWALHDKVEALAPEDKVALRNVLGACKTLEEVEAVIDRALERERRRLARREAAIAGLADAAYRRYKPA